jgi:pyroglutamyl-peptidase
MRHKVLLTGFEPFDGAAHNPSIDAVRTLAQEGIEGISLEVLELPVEFVGAGELVCAAIARIQPDIVLSVGLAAGRYDITVERVAVNLADARIADNSGEQPVDQELTTGGVAAYFSTLPVKETVAAIRGTDVAASLSYSAGTYVCNAVMYHTLRVTADGSTQAGFIHIPDVYAVDSKMTLEDVVTGLRAAVLTCTVDRAELSLEEAAAMGREY